MAPLAMHRGRTTHRQQHPTSGQASAPPCSVYTRVARAIARFTGRPAVFLVALSSIAVWAVCGPVFGFSDTWQLLINTSTTIITFLMVFLIQNTQNRDTEAIQLKLDELIRATEGARNTLIGMEEMDEHELEQAHQRYAKLAQEARQEVNRRQTEPGKGRSR